LYWLIVFEILGVLFLLKYHINICLIISKIFFYFYF
jgi:hypothetical protein